MNELEKITFKYHEHLEGTEPEGMMYFKLEDVHKAMQEYAEYKLEQLSQASKPKDLKGNPLLDLTITDPECDHCKELDPKYGRYLGSYCVYCKKPFRGSNNSKHDKQQ